MQKIRVSSPTGAAQSIAGASLNDAGFLGGIKRRGRLIAGTALAIAAIGLMTLGTGCERKEPATPTDGQEARQVDSSFQQRKELITQRARKLQGDSREIENLRRQGVVGSDERIFRFGNMIVGESEEPMWHRMAREDSSGVTNHSEDDVAQAMVDAVKRINQNMFNTKSERQTNLDAQELDLLREQLGDKLVSDIIEEDSK